MEDKIRELFKTNNLHYYWYIVSNNVVSIYVEWGDWKHDHIFLKNLMMENGFQFLGEETDDEEENGDDSYSATHTYKYLNVK